MKTIKRSFRVWFGVLLISVGALCLTAIWAQQPIDPGTDKARKDCDKTQGFCMAECEREMKGGHMTKQGYNTCLNGCYDRYYSCMSATATAGGTPGPTATPTQTGPTS